MKVTVKLFAYLRQGRFKASDMDFTEGSTVLQVLNALAIVANDRNIGILFINGKHAEYSSVLKEGDVLAIFPPVAGG